MKRISTILPALILLTLTGCASKPIEQPPPTPNEVKSPQPPVKSAPKREEKLQPQQWMPNVIVPAFYPQIALDQGVEGYVLLEYTVTKTGTLQDIIVIDSSPPGYFETAAIEAAQKFRYPPKIVNGKPVDVPRAQYKMIFELKYLRPKS